KNGKKRSDTHAQELSYGARQLLRFAADQDLRALFDAIRWQKKAIALRPGKGQDHHTLARLLYRIGFYDQAEAEQKLAIELSASSPPYHQQMLGELKQLQSRAW